MHVLVICLILCLFSNQVAADTPANCTFEEIKGSWNFYEGPRGKDNKINCDTFSKYSSIYTVKLDFPDIATDADGNIGFWTLIYNQGFEVVINGRKYFAFSYFEQDGDNVTSFCDRTFTSTSHDVGVNPINWSCFYGNKSDHVKQKTQKIHTSSLETFYQHDEDFLNKINQAQANWRAVSYEFMNKKSIGDLVRMAGGKKSIGLKMPKPAKPTTETLRKASLLPDHFDWRNVSGVNFVSPVRNQGSCGSCYAFGSMALHEARIRIKTNNLETPVFSTQDIVECSPYSQGCDGGFPYLIAGKYAEDFGLVDEKCNPYIGSDGDCHTDPSCIRRYGTNYRYIGGFYGACNEALMRIALVNNGPLAVSFQVYDDFMSYKGGVYHHTGIKDTKNFRFNPWEITNHVVLIVGYGKDPISQEDYWIVKNSWGVEWGESGFFRILRGNDECSIESIAVEIDPVIKV